jgi:hypothetical protein
MKPKDTRSDLGSCTVDRTTLKLFNEVAHPCYACTCSVNLFPDWQRCCDSIIIPLEDHTLKILPIVLEEDDEGRSPEVISLLPCNDDEFTEFMVSDDSWLNKAYTLKASIDKISSLLQERAGEYADFNFVSDLVVLRSIVMTEAEKSFMEASLESFIVRTTEEIKMLRETLIQNKEIGGDVLSHKNGIISILFQSLCNQVAMPMEALKKIRHRKANLMRQHPLSCYSEVLGQDLDDNDDDDFFLDKPRSFRYKRSRTSHTLASALESCSVHGIIAQEVEDSRDFWSAYDDSIGEDNEFNIPFRPVVQNVSLEDETYRTFHEDAYNRSMNLDTEVEDAIMQSNHPTSATSVPNDPIYDDEQQPNKIMDTELQEQLYQEHLLLTDTFERSGYDAVGKMETTMVEITALLNQFSQLIANQEEDVLLLHEQTKTAKTYVESGQDKLVDAAERGKKSHHLMATFIVFLALVLLFLHLILP